MRLLQVTQSYYPFLERGGPAVKVRAMARGLAQRGHSITVLTADLGLRQRNFSDRLRRDRWGWRDDQDSVQTIYLSSLAAYRAITLNPAMFAFCRERLRQFDLVHVYGFYDLLGPAVASACRRLGLPYVVEPMGMFRPIVRSIAAKRVYHRLLGDAMVQGARRIVATSAQERSELIEESVPANRVVVRRNGIEAPECLPPPGVFRRAWNIPDDVRIILFLGRLVSKKSPELLLDAFAGWRSKSLAQPAQPRAIVVFAGPAESDAYRRGLEAQAAGQGLDGQVLFTGPLYDQAKWSAYRDADVFVLPSQNENFGNTAAEAVVCGTPVLVTDQCGISPLIAPAAAESGPRAGIVVPHDRDALTAALSRLLDNPTLLEELRQGCATVAQKLDWDQPLDETEALYVTLTREHHFVSSAAGGTS